MLRENAVVLDYANGIAKVKCQSQSACGQCAAKSGCGGNSLSELNGKRGEHIFSVASLMPLRAGQIVEIGLEEKSMLLSALLTYIVLLCYSPPYFPTASAIMNRCVRSLFSFSPRVLLYW